MGSKALVPETMEGLRRQNSAYRSLCATLELRLATETDFSLRWHEMLTEQVERLENALEWALDHSTDSDHPHYPERVTPRTSYAVWHYPYLISGTPSGGGVGHANFPSALEAVEAARLEKGS